MYEGKNIHYSPLDNKPLCSYSAKVCKQRRLNGFALCLRHILEDRGAPFRQCLFLARNKQQCTNPIPLTNGAEFCTSHLQLLAKIPLGGGAKSRVTKEAGKSPKNGLNNIHGQAEPNHIKAAKGSVESDAKNDTQAVNDPYTFSESDPPKTLSKTSPPLVTMVADSCALVNSSGGSSVTSIKMNEAAAGQRSMPISRLYPELVEKLECDSRGKPEVKAKGSNNRLPPQTLNQLQCKIAQKRLKKCQSPTLSSTMLEQKAPAVISCSSPPSSSLSMYLCQKIPSASIAGSLSGSSMTTSSVRDAPALTPTSTVGSSTASRMPAFQVGNPWLLPVFGSQPFSQALQGLLNSSAQHCFNSMLQTAASRNAAASSLDNSTVSIAQTVPGITSSLAQHLQFSETKSSACLPILPVITASSSLLVSSILSTSTSTTTSSKSPRKCFPSLFNTKKNNLSNDSLSDVHWVKPRLKTRTVSSSCDKKSRCTASKEATTSPDFSNNLSHLLYKSMLLPVGVDSSSEESDLDLEELPWQRLWNGLSSDEEDADFDVADDVMSNIRRTKLQLLKSKLRRQLVQLQQCHDGNLSVRHLHENFVEKIIKSARRNPELAVEELRRIRGIKLNVRRRTTNRPHAKRPCLHKDDEEAECKGVAFPFANHCLRHIMYNVDQQLFGYCTAKFADNSQCCVPVFDLKHELPLCPEHASKADSYQLNHEPKPKKQRKKTKPSALTRPPKKGKKKKTQSKVTVASVKVQSDQDIVGSSGNCLMSDNENNKLSIASVGQEIHPSTTLIKSCDLRTSPSFATEALSKDSLEDTLGCDLDESLLPSNLDLHLDSDPATSFLDGHDLHDVLNKEPDEAFDLLTGKNGDYAASKEADEALVRALAEVSKRFGDSKSFLDHTASHHLELELLPDAGNDDDITKQIADSLLNRNSISPSGSLSDDNLNDLASSLMVNDLKSISQALSPSVLNHSLGGDLSMSTSEGYSYLLGSNLFNGSYDLGLLAGEISMNHGQPARRSTSLNNYSGYQTNACISESSLLCSHLSNVDSVARSENGFHVSDHLVDSVRTLASNDFQQRLVGDESAFSAFQSLPEIQSLIKLQFKCSNSSSNDSHYQTNLPLSDTSTTIHSNQIPPPLPTSLPALPQHFFTQTGSKLPAYTHPLLPANLLTPAGLQTLTTASAVGNQSELYLVSNSSGHFISSRTTPSNS